AYEGAPAVDIKRPYGNSNVEGDIANILGYEIPGCDSVEYNDFKEHMLSIHEETAEAMSIVLKLKTFEPGIYIREDYNEWRKATEEEVRDIYSEDSDSTKQLKDNIKVLEDHIEISERNVEE